jgi:hypothetical protein
MHIKRLILKIKKKKALEIFLLKKLTKKKLKVLYYSILKIRKKERNN